MILIDGDMLVYRVGFACDDEPEEIATQTLDNYLADIVGDLADHYSNSMVYLTGKGNFRDEVAVSQPYKGGRYSQRKPVHKEALRDYMENSWFANVVDGIEADDAIAYIAKQVLPNSQHFIMSTDTDFLQLVDERIQVWSPTAKKFYFRKDMQERFNLKPENYILYKKNL